MLLFTKPGRAQQTIQLYLSDDGEYWTGAGGTLRDLSPNQRKDRLHLSRAALSKDVLLFARSGADQHAHSHEKP